MMQLLLATIACLALATATSANTSSESNTQREFLLTPAPQTMTAASGAMVPLDGAYPTLAELSLPSDQADRIRFAMTRFLSQSPNSVESRFAMVEPMRIRTRSAPNESEDFYGELLSSIKAEHEKEQRSIHHPQQFSKQQQQQQQQQASSGGYKSLRNVQPVFLRLPSRFGKRSAP